MKKEHQPLIWWKLILSSLFSGRLHILGCSNYGATFWGFDKCINALTRQNKSKDFSNSWMRQQDVEFNAFVTDRDSEYRRDCLCERDVHIERNIQYLKAAKRHQKGWILNASLCVWKCYEHQKGQRWSRMCKACIQKTHSWHFEELPLPHKLICCQSAGAEPGYWGCTREGGVKSRKSQWERQLIMIIIPNIRH